MKSMMRVQFIIVSGMLLFSAMALGCDVAQDQRSVKTTKRSETPTRKPTKIPDRNPIPYLKADIDQILEEIQSDHDYRAMAERALERTSSSYKPEAVEKLSKFLLASEDIVKGQESKLFQRLNYPIDLPRAKDVESGDEVVIVLDAGFTDTFLTYAKDIVAYFEMSPDGHLHKKELDFIVPRWAWYLYELQADAGNPFRVLHDLAENEGTFKDYLHANLLYKTNFLDSMKRLNESELLDSTIFYKGGKILHGYHGSIVAYTLKEWAPSVKLILVSLDPVERNRSVEEQMLQDLDKITQQYGAGIVVRSNMGEYYWYGLKENGLLKKQIIVNAGLDRLTLEKFFRLSRGNITKSNFIFANTFSSACTSLVTTKRGETFSSLRAKFPEIEKFSFASGKFQSPMLEYSTVFADRHVCFHKYNPRALHITCLQGRLGAIGFDHFGFEHQGAGNFPYSVSPTMMGGDASSAAPFVAAWALHAKNEMGLTELSAQTAARVTRYINGIRSKAPKDPYLVRDPIAHSEFPIFEEGYGNGLIIPKKFTDN